MGIHTGCPTNSTKNLNGFLKALFPNTDQGQELLGKHVSPCFGIPMEEDRSRLHIDQSRFQRRQLSHAKQAA